MNKLFVSVPMRDRELEDIFFSMNKMKEAAENYFGEELEVIDSWIKDAPEDANSIWYLGKSIELMSQSDYFIGCKDVGNIYPSCSIENKVAETFDLMTYYIDVMNPYFMPDVFSGQRKLF